MADKEKVIGHLNDCVEASRRENTWVFVRKDIVEDALSLLKEQRTTVEIVAVTKENGGVNLFAFNEAKDAIKCFCYWKDKGAMVTSGEVDIQ